MKTKILVGYSTNRDIKFQTKFFKEIKASIGCEFDVMPIYNTGTLSLTRAYNRIWETYPFTVEYIFVFIHKKYLPQLLLATIRFLVPNSLRYRILFSGIPHKPNPPTKILLPSGILESISRGFFNIFEEKLNFKP